MAASKGLNTPLLVLRCREPCARTREKPLGVKGSPSMLPARKLEPRSYNHRELDSANNLDEQGNGFSPEPLERNAAQPTTCFYMLNPALNFF